MWIEGDAMWLMVLEVKFELVTLWRVTETSHVSPFSLNQNLATSPLPFLLIRYGLTHVLTASNRYHRLPAAAIDPFEGHLFPVVRFLDPETWTTYKKVSSSSFSRLTGDVIAYIHSSICIYVGGTYASPIFRALDLVLSILCRVCQKWKMRFSTLFLGQFVWT